MTATRHRRKRALVFPAAMLALLLAGVLPQPAFADDPPPVTVPTPTVPAPTPDTAPKRAPAPTPRYRPPATRSYSPPQYTPAQPIAPQPATTTVGRPVASPAKTPKKHPVVPIVPIRQQSAPTHARAKFRPSASERAPGPSRPVIVRSTDKTGGVSTWVLPLAFALVIGTALAVAGRSRRVKAHLSRLTPHVRRLLALAEPARPRIARALRQVATANPRRFLPRELMAHAPARLSRVSFDPLRHVVSKLQPQLSVANARSSIEHRAAALVETRRPRQEVAAVAPMPQPAVARLEPVARLEAFPEPEAAPLILSTPPSPEAEEAAPAPPTEELCEITVWRGYTRSRFYARLDVAARFDAEGCAVAESMPFRFTGNGTLEQTEAAEAAHRALVEELMARGWEPCDSRGPWYAVRFSRALVALS